jgi:hypothetical protein
MHFGALASLISHTAAPTVLAKTVLAKVTIFSRGISILESSTLSRKSCFLGLSH